MTGESLNSHHSTARTVRTRSNQGARSEERLAVGSRSNVVFGGTTSPGPVLRFTIVSTCPDAWGGSEELWSGAAQALAASGHEIWVFKTSLDARHPRVQQLARSCRKVRN